MIPQVQTNASINIKPEGGGKGVGGPRVYVGQLTFQKNLWSKLSPWAPKFGQIRSNILHLPTLDFQTKQVGIINNPCTIPTK